MKKFSIQDVQGSKRFPALTQEEILTINELVFNCTELQSQIGGFVKTRKDVLHNRFDRKALMEYIELLPHFDKENGFMVKLIKNLLEKIGRDFVRDYMVEDFVACTLMKLELFDGDKEKLADYIEQYLTCGKVVPMSQTWKELSEELEKGEIIYYEPSADRAV